MPTLISTTTPDSLEPAIFPELARTIAAELAPSLTLAKGTVLGKITATGKLAAYNDSLTNGVEVAVAILKFAVVTDSSGNAYFSDSDVASPINLPHREVPVYIAGCFATADLTGYDANALADFKGRVLACATTTIGIPL